MATRFSTHKFCAAWAQHGPESKTWDEFVGKMKKASGNENYPESEIKRRLEQYQKQLKGKMRAPYYPAERKASALSFFEANKGKIRTVKAKS